MMNWALSIILCCAAVVAFPLPQGPAASAEKKFRHIERNGKLQNPDQTPTVLTEEEVNAYFAAGKVELPDGVKSVRFRSRPGMIDALARVDFDQITASRRSANPLLLLFTGTHNVRVLARAAGAGGIGEVHVQAVEIDGVGVPRAALEFFLERYVTPRHPQVRMDTRFKLPHKLDLAIVGSEKLTVTQK
jgi:hypothetical protein